MLLLNLASCCCPLTAEGPTKSGPLQSSQGCSHWELELSSLVCLNNSQASIKNSLFELLPPTERSPRGLNYLNCRNNRQKTQLRVGIILGTIPSCFAVFHAIVQGCSRNSSGECPYLGVQEKFVHIGHSIQNAGISPAQFLGLFSSDFASNLLKNILDAVTNNSRNRRVLGTRKKFHFDIFFLIIVANTP